jgi:hypothetical protein
MSQPPDQPPEGWQPPQQPTQPLPEWSQQPTQPQWGPPPGGPSQPPPGPPYGQQPGWGPPPQRPKPRRPWYLRWWSITLAVLAVLFIIGIVAGDPNSDTTSKRTPTTAAPGTSAATPTTQPPATEALTTAAPAAPRPQTISGRGKTATKAFRVDGGMTVFRFQHQGQSNFIIGLLTSRGEAIDGLVNEIGTISGSTARGLEAGRYLFNVEADGPWSIRIEQPRPGSGRDLPTTAKGQGHSVAGPFQATGAGVRFELRHRGESNFIVDVLDVDGQVIGNLSNEIGMFEGSTVGEVPEGVFWLNVQADGSWTVTMRPL